VNLIFTWLGPNLPAAKLFLAKQAPQIYAHDPRFDLQALHGDLNGEVVAFFKDALAP